MGIYEKCYPDVYYKKVGDIDIGALYARGIRFAILDIDNTLVPYTQVYPSKSALEFLNKLTDNGIKFCFVSNNKGDRVRIFNEKIGAVYFSKAKKPLLPGIRRAMEYFGAEKGNTVMIGDQIFTDICGARNAGIYSVLVEPIKEVDTYFFRFKRYWEKKVLKSYKKHIENEE